MGLDNGIVIKVKKAPSLEVSEKLELNSDMESEIVYFRKCWGIRNSILSVLGIDDQGGGEYEITIKQLFDIWETIEEFLDEDYFKENADSYVFDYDEMLPHIEECITKMRIFLTNISEEDIEYIKFYDSY